MMQRACQLYACAVCILIRDDLYVLVQRDGDVFGHAADFPCVVVVVYVLEHQQAVAGIAQVFAAIAANAYNLAALIDAAGHAGVGKLPAAVLFTDGGFTGRNGGSCAALRRNHLPVPAAFPAQRIVYRVAFAEHFGKQLCAFFAYGRKFLLCALVHAGDGCARGDVVELVEQKQLPVFFQLIRPFGFDFPAFDHQARKRVLDLPDGNFSPADQTLGF